jgi:hypothetical protein
MTTRAAFTVAVAEDPLVCRYLRTLLGRHGFQTVENEPPVTLKLMKSGQLQPDVLITNTPDAFAGFADRVRILYLAAAPDPQLVRAFRNSRTLQKPFHAEQLLNALDELAAVY